MELIQDSQNIHQVRKALQLVAPLPIIWATEADGACALSNFTTYHVEQANNKFARTAILYGIANGWKPNDRRPPLFCIYSQGTFLSLTPQLETLISHY
jgi:hypothetical protein